MLLLDGRLQIGPVTLFRDHADPATFHYLPGVPGPRVGGIGLLVYRGTDGTSAGGGGLLTLDVELAHPAGALDAARAALQQRGTATVNLVPVLFDRGTVRLTALGAASTAPAEPTPVVADADSPADPTPEPGAPAESDRSAPTVPAGDPAPAADPAVPAADPAPAPVPVGIGLVEQVLGVATPSLLGGGNRAVFSVRLDPEGAVAMRAAVESRRLPAAVVYQLAFRGILPANGMSVQLDYEMAYQYLRTRAAGATLWLKVDVDREAEALERAGQVRIVDVDYTGSDPAVLAKRREDALATLRETVETLFFRPATAPSSMAPEVAGGRLGDAVAGGGLVNTAFVLRDLDQHEQQSARYDRTELEVTVREVAPQGSLELPAGTDPADVVHEVDLVDEDAPRSVPVAAVDGADWTGIDAVSVDLRSADGIRSVVLTPEEPAATLVLPAGPAEQRIRVLASAQPQDLGAVPVPSDSFAPLDAGVLIDPAGLAGRRPLTVLLGAVPADLVSAVTVDVAVGDQRRTVVLGPNRPTAELIRWGPVDLAVDAEFETAAGSLRRSLSVSAGERAVALNLPAEQVAAVLASAVDPLGRYVSIDVELDTGPGTNRQRLTLDANRPSAYWTRVRTAGDSGGYRHRVTTARRDGVVHTADWTAAAGALLVVGDTDLRLDGITVVLTGWTGLAGALLTLTSAAPVPGAPASVEVLISTGSTAQVVLPGSAAESLRYDVSGQVFLADGAVEVELVGQTAEVLLIVPPG